MVPELRIHALHRESARYRKIMMIKNNCNIIECCNNIYHGCHVPANKCLLALRTWMMLVTLLVCQKIAGVNASVLDEHRFLAYGKLTSHEARLNGVSDTHK